MKMRKPNLNKIWETFIKIGLPNNVSIKNVIPMIRFKIHPMISNLEKKNIINWYCFLIHNRETGVPTTEDDDNLYFHIRVGLKKDVSHDDFLRLLPDYCVKELTSKVNRKRVAEIHMSKKEKIDTSLFRSGKIEEAWKVLGEQSEWVLNMLDIHREEVDVPIQYIGQFLHYFFNMMAISVACPKCGHLFSI